MGKANRVKARDRQPPVVEHPGTGRAKYAIHCPDHGELTNRATSYEVAVESLKWHRRIIH